MQKTIYLLLLAFLFSLTACVPTERITYLQEGQTEENTLITIREEQAPYRIQVSDVLSIRVKAVDQEAVAFLNPTTSAGATTTLDEGYYYDGFAVDIHGNIRIPQIGEVAVLGKTTEEIRLELEKILLETYVKGEAAELFMTVKLAGIRYTLAGEITSPGVKIELTERLSLLDAIANAGGVPVTGDLTDVTIYRKYPGGQRIHHIDLTRIEAMQSPYYYIQPNDLIIVNPLPQKAIGIGTTGISAFTTILGLITTLASVILLARR